MKTSLHRLCSFVLNLSFCGGLLVPVTTWADTRPEMTDREYETFLVERKRDFDRFMSERKNTSDKELLAAKALKDERARSLEENNKNLLEYREKMVRYSMEEVEAKERDYQLQLKDETAANEAIRVLFVKNRNRLQDIEKRSPAVDPYQELEIDLKTAPESKASSTGILGEMSKGF